MLNMKHISENKLYPDVYLYGGVSNDVNVVCINLLINCLPTANVNALFTM